MFRLFVIHCAAASLLTTMAYGQGASPPATPTVTGIITGSAPIAAGGGGTASASAGTTGGGIVTVSPSGTLVLSTTDPASGVAAGTQNTMTSTVTAPNAFYTYSGGGPAGWTGVTGPASYINMITGAPPADEDTMKLLQADRELSGKISAIVAGYKGITDNAKRTEAEQQIAKLVAEQFSVRQQMREKQLQALEEQIKQLRTLHGLRTEQRDQIVNDRVRQLLRDAMGMGWGDATGGGDFDLPLKIKAGAALGDPLGVAKVRRAVARSSGADGGGVKVETYNSDDSTVPAPLK